MFESNLSLLEKKVPEKVVDRKADSVEGMFEYVMSP